MRILAMRGVTVMIGTAVALSGCGQQRATSHTGAVPTPVNGHGLRVASCQRPAVPAGRVLAVTASDNGQTFCVMPRASVEVDLHGTGGSTWAGVSASAHALRARPGSSKRGGTTQAAFTAVSPGTVTLTSSSMVCGGKGNGRGSTRPGQMTPGGPRCDAMVAFRVTIVVES